MSRKKKFLIVMTILVLLMGGFIAYSLIQANNIKNAIAWVEENNGRVYYVTPKWVEKLPSFMQKYVSKEITSFTLRNKSITDISPLKYFSNLKEINLSGTLVSDISSLKNLTHLTYLNLSKTQISDISSLKNLTNLTKIRLDHTQVSDISPLKNLTNLKYLYLFHTPVSDLSPLKNLTNLTRIFLEDTQVSDISSLKNLSKLEILLLPNKPELKAQVEELEKTLPHCYIEFE